MHRVRVDLCFHSAVAIHVEEQDVIHIHVRAAAGVGYRHTQVNRPFAVSRLLSVVPVVRVVVQIHIVGRQVTESHCPRRAVVEHRILRIDHLDDLFVREAIAVGDARNGLTVVGTTEVAELEPKGALYSPLGMPENFTRKGPWPDGMML